MDGTSLKEVQIMLIYGKIDKLYGFMKRIYTESFSWKNEFGEKE